jgi:hypothetical protein
MRGERPVNLSKEIAWPKGMILVCWGSKNANLLVKKLYRGRKYLFYY